MAKAKILRPTKKADKECFDLLHRAWRAGVIDDFRYGTDTNSWAVSNGNARGRIGWTIESNNLALFVENTAEATEMVASVLRERGIDVAWGASWCGYREIIVTEREVAAA